MARSLSLRAPFLTFRRPSARTARPRKPVLGILEDRTLPSVTLWTQRGGDAGHSGYVDVSVNPAQFQSVWNQPLTYVASGAWAQHGNRAVAIDGTQVYRTDLDGYWASGNYHVMAYNLQTGTLAWNQIIVGNGPVSAPSVANGTVYINRSGHSEMVPYSGYPFLYGLNAQTGAVNLQTPYEAQWESDDRPVIAGNQLFDWDGYYGGFSSWDATTLTWQWNNPGSMFSQPMAAADSTYVYTYDNSVYLRSNGAAQTSITHPTGLTPSAVVVSGSGPLLYTLSGTVNGVQEYGVAAYDGSTHALLWTTYTSAAVAGKAVGNGIVAVTAGQQLLFLDESTGNVLGTWTTPAPALLTSQVVLTRTHAFVETASTGSATIYAVNVSTDASDWSFQNTVSGPDDSPYMEIAFGSGYLVVTNDAFVQAFTATAVNQPPVAGNDSASTLENQAVSVHVLANDSDPDGDTLTVTALTPPSFGSAVINSDNTITYTPPADFIGSDSFTYTVSDGRGATATATVAITVTPPTNGPVANPGGPYSVDEGESVTLDGSGSSDTGGTLTTYEWDFNYNGSEFITDATGVAPTFSAGTLDAPLTDTVALRVTDSLGNRSLAVTTVTVNDVAPTAGISGPTDGYAGVVNQQRSFALTATEPLAAEQAAGYTFVVNWGDGQTDTLTGQSGLLASHRWQAAGNYTMSLTATDAEGNSSQPVQLAVNVLTTEQQGNTLAIGAGAGTAYSFNPPGATTGTIQVWASGALLGTFSSAQIEVYGTGTATVNGTTASDAFTLTATTVSVRGVSIGGADLTGWTVNGLGGNNTFAINGSGLQALINGGANNDTFTIAAGVILDGSIVGNGGKDTLTANSQAGASTSWVINAAGAGTVHGAPFSGMSNLTGGLGNDTFSFQPGGSISGKVNGGGGSNTLDESAYTNAVTVNLASHTATGLGSFTAIKSILAPAGYSNTLQGTGGTNTWKVSGSSSGTVSGIAFSAFQTLLGGAGTDTFTIAAGVTFSGSLAGGGGTNTLVGSSATGAGLSWVINAAGGGTVNGTPFSGMSNLTGGAGDDVFTFQPGGSLAGKLNGGAGKNWLDASALTTDLAVNVSGSAYGSIPANSASIIFGGLGGGVTSIKYIQGGSGNDTLVGGGGNILSGGDGNDLLVNNSTATSAASRALLLGGLGSDTLTAGAAGELLIAGTTNYDSNHAALLAILAEWQSASSYATRFGKIQSGVGTGSWQLIWGSTVQDDSAIDTLNGGPGLDWYFAQQTDPFADVLDGLVHGQEYVDNGLST